MVIRKNPEMIVFLHKILCLRYQRKDQIGQPMVFNEYHTVELGIFVFD